MMYFVFKKTGKNTMDMFMISLAVSGIFFKFYWVSQAVWIEVFYWSFAIRFHVLATATDGQTKDESQNIKSGKRVTVSMAA